MEIILIGLGFAAGFVVGYVLGHKNSKIKPPVNGITTTGNIVSYGNSNTKSF